LRTGPSGTPRADRRDYGHLTAAKAAELAAIAGAKRLVLTHPVCVPLSSKNAPNISALSDGNVATLPQTLEGQP
jgi:ribonuclease BN (tRNA processing enzyme)